MQTLQPGASIRGKELVEMLLSSAMELGGANPKAWCVWASQKTSGSFVTPLLVSLLIPPCGWQ